MNPNTRVKDSIPSVISDPSEMESLVYCIDKYVFTVTPIYEEQPGKCIHDILLELMKRDSENQNKPHN